MARLAINRGGDPVITVGALILLLAGGYAWIRFLSWVVRRAETIRCEPLGDPPCRMCDKPATGPDHDCADPVDEHFATIPQAIDCSALSDSEVEMLRRNTIEDLTEEERAELERQFTDAVAMFQGPLPYVPGPEGEA